mmetsp:Transcript_19595/g.20305  ORF Transcript_19595/g.20305 Transcript_19595/m.20305 type:complete len:373 (-) Transcript_19595:113-1231(-)
MNTLTAIEAERVVQILRFASDRLQILANLPLIRDDNLLCDIENPAVSTAIEKQWIAEELLRNSSEISTTEIGGKDIALLKKMHKSSRNTCRNLLAENITLKTIMNKPETSKDTMNNFIKYLNELKTHVHQKLTTTVEDEAANRTQLHDLGEKERQTEESRDALQTKLNEIREEKDKVTFALDQTLRKLQFELHDLTHINKVETDAVNREMSEAISKANSDHELRMKQLNDQVEGLERQLSDLMEKNKEEEQRLRKEKSRAEVALSARITQYDEDMLSRQETIQKLESLYTNELKEYQILKEYFDKIDADLGRQHEEEDIIDAVARRHDFAMGIMTRAAIMIQSCIRAKIARVEVEKLRAKSKKGKKGKKSKK